MDFYGQELTRNRLVVVGYIHELGDKTSNLQLDSGTASVVLFTTLNTSTLVPMDVDGFLPIALFQSIFISHSGRFVILDPSTKAGSRAIKVHDSKEYKEPVVQSMRKESPE